MLTALRAALFVALVFQAARRMDSAKRVAAMILGLARRRQPPVATAPLLVTVAEVNSALECGAAGSSWLLARKTGTLSPRQVFTITADLEGNAAPPFEELYRSDEEWTVALNEILRRCHETARLERGLLQATRSIAGAAARAGGKADNTEDPSFSRS